MTATATTKTALIERQRFSRCKNKGCKFPIYVRQEVLSDGSTKLLAYNFFNNTRHRCYLDAAEVLLMDQAEAAEREREAAEVKA